MATEIAMPKLGLTMTHGTIVRWLKSPGDQVAQGEPVLEVATDKINYEVESPAAGTLADRRGQAGEEFACGETIGTLVLAGEPLERPIDRPIRNGRIVASPAARKLARERRVDLREITGTGPRGRITRADIDGNDAAQTVPVPPEPIVAQTPANAPAIAPARRTIFRRMSEVGGLPLAHVDREVRVDDLRALLERRGDAGWTAFALAAIGRTVRTHPVLRTDARTGAAVESIDVGLAVDTDAGLVVPVIRGADRCSLRELEAQLVAIVDRARAGRLAPSDAGGACITLSNLGTLGVDRVVPLIDPPQTAIVGMGAVRRRPAVVDGSVVAAWMLTLVVSFDHRFVDGAPAARFLADLAHGFADPGRLL